MFPPSLFSRKLLGITLAAVLTSWPIVAREMPGAALFETSFHRLFVIHRSANENELVYEARLHSDGFDTEDPISIFWIMKTKNDRIEPLTGMERRYAYGVSVTHATTTEVTFSLSALKDRTVTLKKEGGTIRATLLVSGQACELTGIFIQSKGSGLIPKVDYVEVTGKSLATGAEIKEKIGGDGETRP